MPITPNNVDATPKKEAASTHTRHPKSRSTLARHPKSKSRSTPSLRLPPPAPPLPRRSSSFCQAIMFFYACGCRSTEPVYFCQPPDGADPQENPCKHETPEMIVAKLPHACKRQLGTSEACGAEDPGTKEFVREVDTAERLDLAVLDSLEKEVIDTALPDKVEGEFTVDEVLSRSKSCKKKKSRSTFSATATPFVPQSATYVPSFTPPPGEKKPEVAGVNQSEITNSNKKAADGAGLVNPGIAKVTAVEADKVTAATDDMCAKEGHANMGGEKNEHQRNVLAEAEFEEVVLDGEPAEDDNDNFDDLELPELTAKHAADSEGAESTKPSTPWPKVRNEKPASDLTEPEKFENSEPQYDNLLKMLATEKREEEKQRQKAHRSCWNVSALIGALLYGTQA
ncbi:hypothetical protein GGR51DRAFT_439770 [Nemania sp. FL0031]|nr:hypothetical protein GGR51DRAFT_439770 [Nemania sp. FL0031]